MTVSDAPASDDGPLRGGRNPLLDPILRRWAAHPSDPFAIFIHGGAELTVSNREFRDRALRFLALMRANGANAGDIVLIILKQGLDAHAAFVGGMLGGLVPSFLPYPSGKQDPELYWRQQEAVFGFCGARLVLVYDELHATVAGIAAATDMRAVPLSLVESRGPAPLPAETPQGSAIALLQHSSGTTGLKKGIPLSFNTICEQLDSYARATALKDETGSVVVSWLPLYHDMGLIACFLLPAWLGVPIVSLDPFAWIASPASLLDAIERHRATHMWLPNFALRVLVRSARRGRGWDLSSVRSIVGASEPCKPDTYDIFLAVFGKMGIREEALLSTYGMAEAVLAVSHTPPGRAPRRLTVSRSGLMNREVRPPSCPSDETVLLSNGPPIPNCRIGIDDGQDGGAGRIGEIMVNAPFLFSSYHRDPAPVLEDGWYRSGDLGFLHDGEVFVIGRIKDVIIVNGANVFAHDIEAAVSAVAGVKPGRCVAFGLYSEQVGSERLVVLAERADGAATARDAETALAVNRAAIAECGVTPADVRIVPSGWLVKTTSGKTSRSENSRKYEAELLNRGPASEA